MDCLHLINVILVFRQRNSCKKLDINKVKKRGLSRVFFTLLNLTIDNKF